MGAVLRLRLPASDGHTLKQRRGSLLTGAGHDPDFKRHAALQSFRLLERFQAAWQGDDEGAPFRHSLVHRFMMRHCRAEECHCARVIRASWFGSVELGRGIDEDGEFPWGCQARGALNRDFRQQSSRR